MAAAKWTAGRFRLFVGVVRAPILGGVALIGAIFYLAAQLHPSFWSGPWGRSKVVVFGWTILGLAGYVGMLRLAKRLGVPIGEEIWRWILLGFGSLFLLSGLARASIHGGGDAKWYATILSDMITQTHAGVFPVWIGQSQFQYNGGIYTLRVAPAFYYFGAALDTVALNTLGIFALQNLLLIVLGMAAVFAAYFAMARLMSRQRTLAAGLAFLFVSCPGVLGIVYYTDLYMSWTSLPLIPLILFAGLQSFRDGGNASSMLLLGLALGVCWWAHSPIAVWMSLISLAMQIARCSIRPPSKRGWLAIGVGLASFLSISAYPVGAVLLYPPDPVAGGLSIKPDTTSAMIVDEMLQVYPENLLPVSENGGRLSDFQLGYALWGMFLIGAISLRRINWDARVLIAFGCFLVALVAIPISHLDIYLWDVVPTLIRKITGEWVMNRLYLVLSGTIVFAIAAAANQLITARHQRIFYWIVAIGCVWSSKEAYKFVTGSSPTSKDYFLRTENVMLTQYAYFGFPVVPDYFTDGVDDPDLENRLLDKSTGMIIASNATAAEKSISHLDGHSQVIDSNGTLAASFRLETGKHYLAKFEFLNSDSAGVLQIFGETLAREYVLPSSGGPTSFGIGGSHSRFLPLWTSNEAGEDVSIRFVPATIHEVYGPFARVSVNEYDPASLPIQVLGWVPYRASVTSPKKAWLETPRMFQRGYAASVNSTPARIEKTSQGLVAVEVPAGSSQAELDYRAPPGLAFLFWLSISAIAMSFGILAWRVYAGTDGRATTEPSIT